MTRSARPLRITVVSQYYLPEVHGALPASVARGLAARGHDVRVVTSFPNHPYGRVFPGWSQRWRHTELDGSVRVRRVPMFPDHSGRAVRRILSYLSFAASSLLATRSARGSDVVYVYCAQPTAAIAPLLWKLLFRTPYVLHVQDVWPESVLGSDMIPNAAVSRAVRSGILACLGVIHRCAAHVVAIAPGAAKLLVERGSPATETSTIVNWAVSSPRPTPIRASDEGTTRIVYAGNLGPNQGLDAVVRAAARCSDVRGMRVAFVGNGVAAERLRRLAAEIGATNVDFLPPVPRTQMPEVHAEADFEIVALADAPMSRITIPSKLQSALAHGVPVIAAVPGDAADLVENGSAGFVTAPDDIDQLEAAFRAAHTTTSAERGRLAANARAVVAEHMNPVTAIDRLEAVLRKEAK